MHIGFVDVLAIFIPVHVKVNDIYINQENYLVDKMEEPPGQLITFGKCSPFVINQVDHSWRVENVILIAV